MRLKTLSGAPLPDRLAFGEDVLLARDRCTSFLASQHNSHTSSDAGSLKWRRLALRQERLRTGWSQPYLPGSGRRLEEAHLSWSIPDVEEASCYLEQDTTWHDTTLDLEKQSVVAVNDFLQHSLIFHDTMLSSQVAQTTTVDQTISSPSFLTTSFGTTTPEPSSPPGPDRPTRILQVPPTWAITTLDSFPSAQHLRSIYPQTPTPNILCVLLTSPERRDIFVRKGAYKMDLYEITVADDTKSGFKISFWLRPARESGNEQANAQQPLLHSLEHMRVGDILLMRNIALTSFRDTVYGQSLNAQISRARTTVDVLMKSNGIAVGHLNGLPTAVLEALTRLKRWSKTHVAVTDPGPKRRRGVSDTPDKPGKRKLASSIYDEILPPDTMESV